MKRLIGDPRHWRLRAEETRILADSIADGDARREMLKIASSYERMAQLARDKHLAANSRPSKPKARR